MTYLHGEVGVGVEELRAEGQEQLLVGVDDVCRLDERLRAHRLRLTRKQHNNKHRNDVPQAGVTDAKRTERNTEPNRTQH